MAVIKNVKNMAKGSSFLVILQKDLSIHHEGDERSRQYPGHGYPAYTENITNFEILEFSEVEELKVWISENKSANFCVKHCKPVTFSRKTVINLDFQ